MKKLDTLLSEIDCNIKRIEIELNNGKNGNVISSSESFTEIPICIATSHYEDVVIFKIPVSTNYPGNVGVFGYTTEGSQYNVPTNEDEINNNRKPVYFGDPIGFYGKLYPTYAMDYKYYNNKLYGFIEKSNEKGIILPYYKDIWLINFDTIDDRRTAVNFILRKKDIQDANKFLSTYKGVIVGDQLERSVRVVSEITTKDNYIFRKEYRNGSLVKTFKNGVEDVSKRIFYQEGHVISEPNEWREGSCEYERGNLITEYKDSDKDKDEDKDEDKDILHVGKDEDKCIEECLKMCTYSDEDRCLKECEDKCLEKDINEDVIHGQHL